jgi:hypothetical protein
LYLLFDGQNENRAGLAMMSRAGLAGVDQVGVYLPISFSILPGFF